MFLFYITFLPLNFSAIIKLFLVDLYLVPQHDILGSLFFWFILSILKTRLCQNIFLLMTARCTTLPKTFWFFFCVLLVSCLEQALDKLFYLDICLDRDSSYKDLKLPITFDFSWLGQVVSDAKSCVSGLPSHPTENNKYHYIYNWMVTFILNNIW